MIQFNLIFGDICCAYFQGDTLETGHYTAACKNPYDQQWYKFDDQRVNVVPSNRVQEEIVNNEAYILFYQRRKMDSAECSGSNSSSSEHWLSKIPIPINPSTSPTTISSDAKKEDVEKIPDTSEKYETEKIVTHSNKEIQTDDCILESTIESAKEATEILTPTVTSTPTPTPISTPDDCALNTPPITTSNDVPVKVKATDENEVVDVISLDVEEKIIDIEPSNAITNESVPMKPVESEPIHEDVEVSKGSIEIDEVKEPKSLTAIESLENDIDIDIEVELRNMTVKKSEAALSVSFPTQRSLWPFENHHNTIHTYTPILSRGSLNFNELLANERNAHLRHSLSTSLGHHRSSASSDKAKLISVTANDTLAMVRGVSSCSKDTLIYIDQQTHHRSLMEEETNFMTNQPLWVNS